MAANKVVFNGKTLIDLTGDDVTADKLKSGVKAHASNGEIITGTCTHDVDSSDATATAAEILAGRTVYARGGKVTGEMKNNGAINKTISSKDESVNVDQGYHDGAGKVSIAETEQAKLISSNIRAGVTILGVTGDMSATEGVKAQSKTVTPTADGFAVLPDEGFNYLSEVTVAAIPYIETENSAGGTTVTIG